MNKNTKWMSVGMMLLLNVMLLVPAALAQFGGWGNNGGNGVARFQWQGIVDGTTIVRIQGRRATSQNLNGLPVQQQRYDFSDPLPRANVNLDLVKEDGRGRIRLIEEPRSSNDFTAVVRIDDNSGGRDVYRFELRWNDRTRDDRFGNSGGRGSAAATWSGSVDGEVIVFLQRNRAWVENRDGQGFWNERVRFTNALPSAALNVNLVDTRGRGEIYILEQPSRRNQYTACIGIRDRQSGPSNYQFTITWDDRNGRFDDDDRRGNGGWWGNNNGGFGRGDRDDDWRDNNGRNNDGRNNGGTRRAVWGGRVDGQNVIYVRGNRVWFERQTGNPIYDDNAQFFGAWPNGPCQFDVRKTRGRGRVQLLEAPSSFNNYTAKILVDDRDSGDDRYELEMVW